jgi:hypothetical protein
VRDDDCELLKHVSGSLSQLLRCYNNNNKPSISKEEAQKPNVLFQLLVEFPLCKNLFIYDNGNMQSVDPSQCQLNILDVFLSYSGLVDITLNGYIIHSVLLLENQGKVKKYE